jgi:hypothetical protein
MGGQTTPVALGDGSVTPKGKINLAIFIFFSVQGVAH